MRHSLVDKALPNVTVSRSSRMETFQQFRFFQLPVFAVGKQIVRIAGTHDAGPSQCKCYTRSVNGDPAPPPLLRNVRCGA